MNGKKFLLTRLGFNFSGKFISNKIFSDSYSFSLEKYFLNDFEILLILKKYYPLLGKS
jgi:hypothetical protein